MSVVHRVTGTGLYLGTVLIAAWLVAAASGPAAFETAQWIAGSMLGRLILFVYSFVAVPPHGRRSEASRLGHGPWL